MNFGARGKTMLEQLSRTRFLGTEGLKVTLDSCYWRDVYQKLGSRNLLYKRVLVALYLVICQFGQELFICWLYTNRLSRKTIIFLLLLVFHKNNKSSICQIKIKTGQKLPVQNRNGQLVARSYFDPADWAFVMIMKTKF